MSRAACPDCGKSHVPAGKEFESTVSLEAKPGDPCLSVDEEGVIHCAYCDGIFGGDCPFCCGTGGVIATFAEELTLEENGCDECQDKGHHNDGLPDELRALQTRAGYEPPTKTMATLKDEAAEKATIITLGDLCRDLTADLNNPEVAGL